MLEDGNLQVTILKFERTESIKMSVDDVFSLILPDDPDVAFLKLETLFRQELLDNYDNETDYYQYMNKVLCARDELQVEILSDYKIPEPDSIHENDFLLFTAELDRFKTRLIIQNSKRNKTYSVRLDATTKQKVRHLLNQIKGIVDKVELDDRKKEALYIKINALEEEFDRDRTRVEAFGALVIEIAGIVGEAADKMEPARKWLDSIAKCFGAAKSHEDTNPQLPPHSEPKKIEPPRKRLPTPKQGDDDTPF
jgi:hypothetical protein